MANVARPFGLRPVRYLNGAAWTGQARAYYVPSTYATALFIGDPVQVVGDSNANEYFGFAPGSLPQVNLPTAGATNDWVGAIIGFAAITRESTIYNPASTERIAYVADDPNLIFRVQDDGVAALTGGSVLSNTNLVSGTGSTATGSSGWVIDSNAVATAQPTYQVTILGLASFVTGNDIGKYGIWEVKNNQHSFGNAAAPGV